MAHANGVLSQCPSFKQQFPTPLRAPTSLTPLTHTSQPLSIVNNSWLLDSGASHHVTNDLNDLSQHNPYNGNEQLVIGDGTSLPITHIGSMYLNISDFPILLSNVLYVPKISRNILSLSRLCHDNNILISFSSSYFVIKDLSNNQTILEGQTTQGIYNCCLSSPLAYSAITHQSSSSNWHHRLGHPSVKVLNIISNLLNVSSSNLLSSDPCNACNINKSHKLPFNSNTLSSHAPLDLIFSDVWTSPVLSYDHFKYYIVFVDHYTKFMWLYPLKKKSDSLTVFIHFQKLVENYFKTTIKQVYSDNGGEFLKLRPILSSSGISHLTTPLHTPEHNGYAERRNRSCSFISCSHALRILDFSFYYCYLFN